MRGKAKTHFSFCDGRRRGIGGGRKKTWKKENRREGGKEGRGGGGGGEAEGVTLICQFVGRAAMRRKKGKDAGCCTVAKLLQYAPKIWDLLEKVALPEVEVQFLRYVAKTIFPK